jgi:hypothetical protein
MPTQVEIQEAECEGPFEVLFKERIEKIIILILILPMLNSVSKEIGITSLTRLTCKIKEKRIN